MSFQVATAPIHPIKYLLQKKKNLSREKAFLSPILCTLRRACTHRPEGKARLLHLLSEAEVENI